jgi:hypothetical protein
LVQHGTAPDYNQDDVPNKQQRGHSQRRREEARDSLSDTSSLKSEPFYLHPPSNANNNLFSACGANACNNNNNNNNHNHSSNNNSSLNSSLSGLEIYVNPMNATGKTNFYLVVKKIPIKQICRSLRKAFKTANKT